MLAEWGLSGGFSGRIGIGTAVVRLAKKLVTFHLGPVWSVAKT